MNKFISVYTALVFGGENIKVSTSESLVPALNLLFDLRSIREVKICRQFMSQG